MQAGKPKGNKMIVITDVSNVYVNFKKATAFKVYKNGVYQGNFSVSGWNVQESQMIGQYLRDTDEV